MKFNIRNLSVYKDVNVEVNGTSIGLGLLDKRERLELARTLEEAVDELMEGLEKDE